MTMRPLLAIAALILAGCQVQPVAKPAAPIGTGERVTSAQNTATNAQGSLDAAKDDRLGRVASDSDAANKALNEGRTADAKGAVGVQLAHLEGVARNAEESAKLAEAEQHRDEGRADKADETLGELRQSAKGDAVRIADLTRERDAAVKARDKAVDDYKAECATNMLRQQKAIDAALADAKKAQDRQRNAMLHDQAGKLTRIGIGCISAAISIAVLVGFFGSLIVLRKVGLYLLALAVVGFLFLGAAQIIAQPWFMWACAGAILIGCIWFGVWAWRHQKRGDLAAELAARTARVAAVAKTAVPVLDTAYESASAEVKAWLDANIFDRLSSAMNRDEKATVHEVRAEAKLTEAAAQ